MTKVYTQEEVDALRATWEAEEFKNQTKEVLGEINRRLDESNNYKATIGRDVRATMSRIEVLEAARKQEAQRVRDNLENRKEWWRDNFIRFGIIAGVCYEIVSIIHTLGVF